MRRLSDEQREVFLRHIRGKEVHDLGAGDLRVSRWMLAQGASKVIAVDKEKPPGALLDERFTFIQRYFEHYHPVFIDVAVVSWPVGHPVTFLHRLLQRSAVVVYLGKNTDFQMCGDDKLWEHLVEREVRHYLPEMPNSLIVYGPEKKTRPILPEERAARARNYTWMFNEIHEFGGVAFNTPEYREKLLADEELMMNASDP